MATKKIVEKNDFEKTLAEKQNELAKLYLAKYTGKLKNLRSIFNTRKEIARLKTKMHQQKA